VTRNIGQVDGKGVEGELRLAATDYLDIYLGAAWSDTKVDGVSAAKVPSCGGTPTGSCDGHKLPFNPEWKISTIATLHFPLSLGEVFLTTRLEHQSSWFGGIVNDPIEDKSAAFTSVDLRAGFRTDEWEIAGYLDNVADEQHFSQKVSRTTFFPSKRGPTHPRTFGVNASYRF
jgi:iron complex outermembrane recepter protein